MPTRILIISDPITPPSYAPRVMAMYRYLKEAGQDVVLEAGELRKNTSLWQFVGDKIWQQADREFAKMLIEKYPRGRFDVILCSTYYYFPLLTAEKLSKVWGIPYVVDLRDIVEQWGKASYFTTKLPRLGGLEKLLGRWYEQRNLKMRNRVMDGAKAVVTISPWHQQHLQSLTRTPVHLIYNGYDEEELHWEEKKTEVFSIAFIGRFMSLQLRQPHMLLEALGEMIKEGEIDEKEWRLDLYAEAEKEEEVRKLARQYGAEQLVVWHAFAPRKELGKIMNESSVLLALGCPPEEGQHGILGTKVFEAIGVEKPLLLVPSDEDSLAKLIRETGIGCAAKDKEEVTVFLREQFAEWKKNGYTRKCIEGKELFSRKHEAQQMLGVIAQSSYGHKGEDTLRTQEDVHRRPHP